MTPDLSPTPESREKTQICIHIEKMSGEIQAIRDEMEMERMAVGVERVTIVVGVEKVRMAVEVQKVSL